MTELPVPEPSCPCCGRPLSDHDRHVRLKLPNPVLDLSDADREERTWGNDVLMSVKDVGNFVRVLVPIHIAGGKSITYGAWLSVEMDDLKRAYEVWWEPEYAGLKLEGWLASAIPPWHDEVLSARACATVLDPDSAPYLTSSDDPLLGRVLRQEWPLAELADGTPSEWLPEAEEPA